MRLKATVVVNDTSQARPIVKSLAQRGVLGIIEQDPETVLETCKEHSPDLVIVEECLVGMTGIRFLSRLVSTSWTTAAILIVDKPEETVHEMTDGLGILGHIRSIKDTEGLDRLLDTFVDMRSRNDCPAAVPQVL